VEFLLVAVPVLLLGLGSIEVIHWFHVRQVAGLALLQAARAGSVQHMQPAAIAQAFEQALRPLFTGATLQNTDARLQRVMRQRSQALQGAPWQIRIVQPDAHAFAQFAAPALAIARSSGRAAIRNDYQYEQHQQRGQTQDTGNVNTPHIFAANTLVLRLTYPHPPLLPGLGRLLSSFASRTGGYTQQALAVGLLPMVREVRLEMASHPVLWPSLPDGRVIHADAPDAPSGVTVAPCAGLWCQAQARGPAPPPDAAGLPDAVPVPGFAWWEEQAAGSGGAAGVPAEETLPDDVPMCL